MPGGSVLQGQYSAASPPAATGGTLLDGTYHLVSVTDYTTDGGTGPTGQSHLQSLTFTAGTVQIVQRRDLQDGGCSYEHMTGTAVSTGTSPLTFTQTCPQVQSPSSNGYTQTSTSFTLYNQNNGSTRIQVFNKQ